MRKRGIIVLAGGLGLRMGGKNKPLIKLKDKTMIEHVVGKALKVSKNIGISINKNQNPKFFKKIFPSLPVWKDEFSGGGPLAGIVTGIKKLNAEYVAVLSCDTPFVNPEVLRYLFKKVEGFDAAVPIWPNGFLEPLQAVYKTKSFLPLAKDALKKSSFSIFKIIKKLKNPLHVPVETLKAIDPDLKTFFNINTLEDLERALSMYK